MANRYWVSGGTGNWNSTTNWSTASGGASGASVPGAADIALFDASSGSGTATLDISPTIQRLTMTGFTGTLAFGTNKITLNSTGSVYTGATTFTVTGTPLLELSDASATARTISAGAVTEANSISVNVLAGTGNLTVAGNWRNVDFTGYSGQLQLSSRTVYGSWKLSTGMTLAAGANTTTFASTASGNLITSNGQTMDFPLTFNGAGGSWKLIDNMTVGSTRTTTLTAGTLDLDGKTLTTGLFVSSNSNVRALAFGTGKVVITGSGNSWGTGTSTNFTITGTPVVDVIYAGASAVTVGGGTQAEASAISFNFTAGTYVLALNFGNTFKNLDFTGFGGTISNTTFTVYGNFTLGSGTSVESGTSTITFASTNATPRVITSNGCTVDRPVTFNGVGGSWKLIDDMTVGSTRAVTLTSGTLDLDGKTLTTGLFASSGSTARTIAFGSGNITVVGTAGGNAWTTGTSTNLTVTGTPVVNVSCNTATATTVNPGSLDEANSISFNFTTGTYTLTFLGSSAQTAKNADFTGFSGTWSPVSSPILYGSLTLSAGMTVGSSTGQLNFASTGASNTITSNGKTINFSLAFNGAGGVWTCTDALTQGSTRVFTITNGTVKLKAGVTSTVGAFTTSGTASKTLQSTLAGSQATLSQASGVVNATYLTIQDINATGGAQWTASYSVDAGNNDGWLFASSGGLWSGEPGLSYGNGLYRDTVGLWGGLPGLQN